MDIYIYIRVCVCVLLIYLVNYLMHIDALNIVLHAPCHPDFTTVSSTWERGVPLRTEQIPIIFGTVVIIFFFLQFSPPLYNLSQYTSLYIYDHPCTSCL